jgi:hypothetical protein
MTDREYCYKEQAYFPVDEFYDDASLGRCHRAQQGTPHTVAGDPVEGGVEKTGGGGGAAWFACWAPHD